MQGMIGDMKNHNFQSEEQREGLSSKRTPWVDVGDTALSPMKNPCPPVQSRELNGDAVERMKRQRDMDEEARRDRAFDAGLIGRQGGSGTGGGKCDFI